MYFGIDDDHTLWIADENWQLIREIKNCFIKGHYSEEVQKFVDEIGEKSFNEQRYTCSLDLAKFRKNLKSALIDKTHPDYTDEEWDKLVLMKLDELKNYLSS